MRRGISAGNTTTLPKQEGHMSGAVRALLLRSTHPALQPQGSRNPMRHNGRERLLLLSTRIIGPSTSLRCSSPLHRLTAPGLRSGTLDRQRCSGGR
ncbi:hypothetical protein NDU88_004857 [Pleurodeles waltl]|uniref:Uncharacterized protein n=1 Tax=Pleurodeles waltl TaxID=8319 RepID=A0AAV7VL17_PLEWA|nr:hypothetical protein NDU88_004857 [Pleurodeles waltl]